MSLKSYNFLDSSNISVLIPLLDARYAIGQASNVKFGLIKLYDGTGDNVDGTMTQQAISQRLSSIYRFKGSIQDYEDLPRNPEIGDAYNIANPNVANHIKAGDNLAWNGTGWDNLSGLMDLSNYLQKNGEYIKSVSFDGELKTITFLLPDNSTESIILPSGLGSEELEIQDLDLLLDVGVYPINNLSGLSGLPIQELGSLLIFSDEIFTHQLYYTLSGNFFVRVYNHSFQVWTDWSNIKTKLKQIYAETTDLSNPNFNDISLAVCTIENITSATNYPIAKKGLLQNIIGNSYNFQIYTTVDGQVFNRCKTNNVWTSWKEIAPTITIITSGNLNDFTEHKTYHITDTSQVIQNKPDTSVSAEFIVTSSEGYIYQKYINIANTVYIRNKAINDTNFSSWKRIIDSNSITAYAPLNSPTLTGTATYNVTIDKSDSSKKIANTEYVDNKLSDYAPLLSASLTGTPTLATEITKTDNSKKLANTEFVNNYVTEVLKAYAPLASPALTGNPTATTQATSDSSTKIATTAYVKNNLSSYAPLASPALTGNPTVPTQDINNNSTRIANTEFVGSLLANTLLDYAPLVSPTLTGNPTVDETILKTDNSTKIANTAYVKSNLADYMPTTTIQSTYAPLASPTLTGEPKSVTPVTTDNSTKIATTAYVNNLATSKLASYAPLASPEFSGTPKSPDVTAGDSTTKIANTKFVATALTNALASYAPLASPNLTGTPTVPDISAGTSTTQIANTKFVMTAIANLINSAPESLNTLSELSSALNNDPDFANTVMTAIGEKLPIVGGEITGNLKVNGTLTANASSASKLTPGKTIQTNLASTTSATFTGENNITPGVTGVLGTANGGTGNANGTVAQLTNARNLTTNLASTIAGSFNGTSDVSIGISGTLAEGHGGTGATSLANITVGKATYDTNGKKISEHTVEYIVGTQTASTGSWTGVTKDSALYAGKMIIYKLPYAGSGNATLNLTLSGGGTTGAKAVYRYASTRLTTQYGANYYIPLIYNGTYWFAFADYDSTIYDRIRSANAIAVAEGDVAAYRFIGTLDGTNYKEIGSGTTFDVRYPVLYNITAVVDNANMGTGIYWVSQSQNMQTILADTDRTFIDKSQVFIKGTLSGNTFTVHSDILTTTVPTTDDGYYYLYVGRTYSTYQMNVNVLYNQLWKYSNGQFQPVDRYALMALQDSRGQQIDSTYIKGLSVSGKVITYTRGDNTTGTLTTQDTANTDANVAQKKSTTNATYPVLIAATADATADISATNVLFGTGVKINPSTSTIYATTFSGNATSATKATNDSDNNTINTTYSKVADAVASLSANGTTVTFKNKAGTSLGTFTTQDTHYISKLIAGISTSTANATSTNGNTYLRLFDDSTNRGSINIKGTGATTVTSDANGVITINSTDNNTTYNTGTADVAGITKLYTGTGTNTDGTMTQSAIKSALDGKMSSSTSVTNVTQTVKSDNATYPLLAVATANQTTTATAGTIFATGIKLNPSTGNISATSFTGSLTGNVTGNVSGSSGSCTGNSATATKATNDSDNNPINTTYAKLSGATFTGGISGTTGTFSGTLTLTKTTDLSGTANNSPALIIGGAVTSTHMEIDCNEIQAKTNGTSTAALYLNNDGGAVTIGTGGLTVNGNITASGKTVTAGTFSGALTGNVTGNCSGTSSNVTGTVAIANGGTGATTAANARKALFGEAMNTSALAKYIMTINDSWANGGYTTVQQLRNFMGLGDTTGVLPVANGGTGQSSLDSVTVGVSKKVQPADLTGTNTADLVYAKMADNDYFRIRVGGTASNSGYAELATADDGNEPIYVRQYSGVFSTLTRTATLLDGSGNTSFPGTVTASNFTGLASKATGDKNGADITTTYETKANAITGLSLSGTTLTVTKGNNTSSTITLPSGGGSFYGICSTVAETAEKTVACTGYTLATGSKVTVKFIITNTADNPTLNVNSTGAKPIYYRGYALPGSALQANSTYDFVYNGTQYEIVGSVLWTE